RFCSSTPLFPAGAGGAVVRDLWSGRFYGSLALLGGSPCARSVAGAKPPISPHFAPKSGIFDAQNQHAVLSVDRGALTNPQCREPSRRRPVSRTFPGQLPSVALASRRLCALPAREVKNFRHPKFACLP